MDADHHVQHEVPVIIAKKNHLPFSLHVQSLVYVFGSLVLSLAHLLSPVLKFLREAGKDVFGGLYDTVDLFLDEF